MGNYQTPICKWGKPPITVTGVAEDYGHYLYLWVSIKIDSCGKFIEFQVKFKRLLQPSEQTQRTFDIIEDLKS